MPLAQRRHAVAQQGQRDAPSRSRETPAAEDGGFVLIGKGTTVTGEIRDCSLLEVQGTLEGDVSSGAFLVCEGGAFNGTCEASKAEINGVVEGKLTVNGLLDVRGSGRVTGEVSYQTLAVAAGGHVSGDLQEQQPLALADHYQRTAGYAPLEEVDAEVVESKAAS